MLEREHAEKLPSFCREVLNETGFSVCDLDGVAVSIGPGSFTGLRIGLSFAKGIAFSGNLTIVPVPTMLSMVADFSFDGKPVDVCLRSHKEIVYHQQFLHEGETWIEKNEPVCDEWVVVARQIGKESTIVHFGCDDLLNRPERTAPVIDRAPSACSVARLAFQRYEEFSISNYYQIEPNYISSFKTGGLSR